MKLDNQRRFNRYSLIYHLSVFQHDTKELIGHIVDISPEGAMLVSETFIPVGTQIQLDIVLPPSFYNETSLDIKAESVRVCRDVNPDYYDTGFRFLSINLQQQEIIKYLINRYVF